MATLVAFATRPKEWPFDQTENDGHRMTFPTIGEDRANAVFRSADPIFDLSPLTKLLTFDLPH